MGDSREVALDIKSYCGLVDPSGYTFSTSSQHSESYQARGVILVLVYGTWA